MKSTEYLKMAIERMRRKSGNALAKKLDITQGAVSNYLTGRRIMDDTTAARIAEILQIDPMRIIAAANADKEDGEKRKYWENFFMKGWAGVAASIIFAVTFIVTPTPSEAAPVLKQNVTTMYIMLSRIRQLRSLKQLTLTAIIQISRISKTIKRISQMPA